MTISRRSFVAAALAALAGGGSVSAAAVAVAVKKEPEPPVSPPAKSPERSFAFGPVDWSKVPRPKWNTNWTSLHSGYNGHPGLTASCYVSRRELAAGRFDVERMAEDRLTRLLEDATRGDGVLFRILPETETRDGHPGSVVFTKYARAVGERKTVKRVVFRKDGCDVVADMIVEYDSTVGEGEITVSCKASHDLILSSPYNVGEIIRTGVRLQLIAEARDRWGMASTATFDCPERESCFFRTFSQSIRKVTLPSYCLGFPPTVGIAMQLRAYDYACKVNAENGVPR